MLDTGLPPRVSMPEQVTSAPLRHRRLSQRIQNPERLRKWTQLVAVAVSLLGVLGLSAAQIINSPMLLGAAGIIALAVAAIPIFRSMPGVDVYTGKEEVNWLWDRSLRDAEHSVDIVAGDLSWLRERKLHRVLAALVQRGCTVRIICKPPERHPLRRENIAAALFAGAQLRALPAEQRPTPFSALLVLDRDNPRELAVCRFKTEEQPGARADIFDGKSRPEGKKYSARRLLPRRDFEEVQTSLALAKAYWECSRPVVLHEELPWDLPATKSLVVNALRQVPHYHDITDADVYQDAFRIAELSSWCIRQDKLSPSEEIVAEMRKQGTSTSSPTLICSNRPTTILLPPVIEIHDDVRAVMDGTHRLWHLYRGDPNARATVLVVAVSVPLPGVPHLFTKLPYFRVQLDRNSDITAYKAEYWRSFTPMEMFLRSEGEQYLADRFTAFPSGT